MRKENKNFIYNAIYQIFNFIIPLISLPYISRKLGVENIGVYSYTYSIVYYFMLITLLGINNYGVREISKLEGNRKKQSVKFSEIFIIQLSIGTIMLIIYNLLIVFVFKEYKNIFIIHNLFLISAILDINWLYFGLEQFKLTISRNIIIKLLSLCLIIIFVKGENDLSVYTFIMSFSTLLSQLYLWFFRKKNVNFQRIELHKLKKILKDCLILFIPVISYSIYRVMDKTMLGRISGPRELGLYENAEKIISIPVSLITALGTVMLPSMSKENTEEVFYEKIYFSFKMCFFIILPIAFGLIVISDNFSIIFFGKEFAESAIIIKLLIPSFMFSSIASVIRTNYLIPQKKDRIYVLSTIIGAVANLIVNALLIPRFGYYGACIGTIFAEFLVMLYQALNVKNEINFKKVIPLGYKFLFASIVCCLITFALGYFITNSVLKIIIQISTFLFIYILINKKFILNEFFNIRKERNPEYEKN